MLVEPPDNGGNVVSKGLELSTVYRPENLLGVGDISFFANYTFTNANLDGDSTTTDTESIFAGGRDGSNVPYIPEHVLSFGTDYEINRFDFGINMTYHSETYGTAEETETEESLGSANARAGRIDSAFLLNLRAGYKINDNTRLLLVSIMQQTFSIYHLGILQVQEQVFRLPLTLKR